MYGEENSEIIKSDLNGDGNHSNGEYANGAKDGLLKNNHKLRRAPRLNT